MGDIQDDFELLIVVPVRDTDGSFRPDRNRYYLVEAEEVLSQYEPVSAPDDEGPVKYRKMKREPLMPGSPVLSKGIWTQLVERDISMAHERHRPSSSPDERTTTRLIGTFLVNLAAFGNKRP
jgi:hypothetical protein